MLKRIAKIAVGIVGLALLAAVGVAAVYGWRTIFPRTISTNDRLAAFPTDDLPLDRPVTIHWNEYQVPFIEARTDRDLAFTLGLVHAHLRGSQIGVFRLASQGRLAEMAGAPAVPIDDALRRVDLGYAVPDIIESLDMGTRAWLEAFVDGLNYYLSQAERTPPDAAMYGLDQEPYTVADVLTLSRLAGADVNWFSMFSLLNARVSRDDWKELWRQRLNVSRVALPSISETRHLADIKALIENFGKVGSNSVVVGTSKSANGAGMIANDPHLGMMIPNLWLLAGYKSPSYHCVGMMIAGVPMMALGRNEHLAWGGTNMRAATSDLYDVTNIDPSLITETADTIRSRIGGDQPITIRRTPWGPIISDAEPIPSRPGEDIALRWMGHEVTDEIGAFLRANRAQTLPEFVESFQGYAVSSQNMLAVDTAGNTLMTLAVRLPKRSYDWPPAFVLDPDNPAHQWDGYYESVDLPLAFNPPQGYIVSANNPPTDTVPRIGYYFGTSDRIERISQMLDDADSVNLEWLKRMQRDVYSQPAHALAKEWAIQIRQLDLTDSAGQVLTALQSWNGHYDVDSKGALALELLTYHLLQEQQKTTTRSSRDVWSYVRYAMADDIRAMRTVARTVLFADALRATRDDLRRFKTWGEIHRQKAGLMLSGIPVAGTLFRWDEFPVGGSRETVMKTNHEFTNEQHYTSYGSQSRHISLMSDPDSNFFVLFGGEDGWIGSENLIDQVELWKDGEYIQCPLRVETIRQRFPFTLNLQPSTP